MQTRELDRLSLSAESPDNLWTVARSDREPLAGAESARWLVHGVVAAASVCLLAAPPGSYKWWLAWDLARHVANGRPWCGQGTIEQAVLYLDMDNPETVSRDRLRMWPAVPRSVAYLGNWGDDRQRGIPHLERMPAIRDLRDGADPFYVNLASRWLWNVAKAWRPLIVVDSLIRFHMESENDNRGMELVMSIFRRLTEVGATCLVIHHEHQGEPRPRGAGEIEAAADAVFMVNRSGRFATLTARKFRHMPECSYTVEWTEAGFRRAESQPPTAAKPRRSKGKPANADQGVLF